MRFRQAMLACLLTVLAPAHSATAHSAAAPAGLAIIPGCKDIGTGYESSKRTSLHATDIKAAEGGRLQQAAAVHSARGAAPLAGVARIRQE